MQLKTMKVNLYLSFAVMLLASCSGSGNSNNADTSAKTSPADTQLTGTPNAPAVNMQYCFFHTDGKEGQDTTKVSIFINGEKVTGDMSWLPKEKDARKGTLTGVLNGNAIKAIWSFNQEGSKDTMTVEFQLRGNALAQKAYKYDTKTGRQQTDGASRYNVLYSMKNCK
jgi:major membrane immunogen (membrane-anchored lipoprotein)